MAGSFCRAIVLGLTLVASVAVSGAQTTATTEAGHHQARGTGERMVHPAERAGRLVHLVRRQGREPESRGSLSRALRRRRVPSGWTIGDADRTGDLSRQGGDSKVGRRLLEASTSASTTGSNTRRGKRSRCSRSTRSSSRGAEPARPRSSRRSSPTVRIGASSWSLAPSSSCSTSRARSIAFESIF